MYHCNFVRPEGANYSIQKMVLGTHTSDNYQNHLMIAEVKLPLEDTEIDARKYDDDSQGMWLYLFCVIHFEIRMWRVWRCGG